VADNLFVYGHFEEAKARFEPMYRDHCGKDAFGYKAWDKLISMATLTRDATRARQLAEAEKNHSCVVAGVDSAANNALVNNIIQASFYVDAEKVFKDAQEAKPGPEKAALYRKAASMFEGALLAAPARDEPRRPPSTAPFATSRSASSARRSGCTTSSSPSTGARRG
jgi:hypothetical protein